MHAFRIAWERINPDLVRHAIFGFDRQADIDSAQLINALLARPPLPIESAARLGLVLHYLYGAMLGTAYAAARARAPRLASARGIPAGVALWLLADEISITLSGISNPLDRSLASHLSALAAHLVYVFTIEGILRRPDRRRAAVQQLSPVSSRLLVTRSHLYVAKSV
jgi:hypothetical protein